MNTVLTTALQTSIALAAVDPKAAAAVAAAPVILQLLQTIEQMQVAGTLTPEKLEGLYNNVAASIRATHDEWAAM